MYAIRRSLFQPPSPDTILDDLVISMQVVQQGYWFVHEPTAQGFEQNVQEVKGELRRKTRIIAGGIQCLMRGQGLPGPGKPFVWFKFVSHKLLRWFSGPMGAVLLLALTALVATGQAGLLLTCIFYILTTCCLLALLGHFAPATRRLLPVNMLHYFFMLNLASLKGCFQGLTGRQSVQWKQDATAPVDTP